MNPSRWAILFLPISVAAWLALPSAVHGQTVGAQIQVANADAIHQIILASPADLQAVQSAITPLMLVDGADGIGRYALASIDQTLFAGTADAQPVGDVANAFIAPDQRMQVSGADSIGRFDLHPISAAAPDTVQAEPGDVTTPGAASLAPALRIQVTGADAIGNLALQPISAPQLPASQATSIDEASIPSATAATLASDRAVVATDGKLNVRSGPGREFDIIGQLDTGDGVMVLKRSDDDEWLLVMADGGLTGWVSAQFMELR